MRVISNFDDVNPTISGYTPTIDTVGRSGNGAVFTGQTGYTFYFPSEQVSRDDTKIYSGWVKVNTGATGLVGLCLRETAGAQGAGNGYQFFIDNRAGTGSTSTMQIRKENFYTPPLGENGTVAAVTNGSWYRIEIQYRETAPNLCMRLYDETGIKMGEVNAHDTSYNSSTMYLGAYGNSEYAIVDEITEQSALPSFKGIYFANSSNGYKYRKKLTVNPTKMSGSNYKFVSLVSMTDENLKSVSNGGGVTNGTLLDVRFETPEGVKLPHQIEKYVASTGQIIAWVGHDIMFANTEIYMYYGSTIVAATTEDNWIPSVTTSGIKLGVLSSDITANRNSNSAAGGYNLGELFSKVNTLKTWQGRLFSYFIHDGVF